MYGISEVNWRVMSSLLAYLVGVRVCVCVYVCAFLCVAETPEGTSAAYLLFASL